MGRTRLLVPIPKAAECGTSNDPCRVLGDAFGRTARAAQLVTVWGAYEPCRRFVEGARGASTELSVAWLGIQYMNHRARPVRGPGLGIAIGPSPEADKFYALYAGQRTGWACNQDPLPWLQEAAIGYLQGYDQPITDLRAIQKSYKGREDFRRGRALGRLNQLMMTVLWPGSSRPNDLNIVLQAWHFCGAVLMPDVRPDSSPRGHLEMDT
jgi:hypothetical protein